MYSKRACLELIMSTKHYTHIKSLKLIDPLTNCTNSKDGMFLLTESVFYISYGLYRLSMCCFFWPFSAKPTINSGHIIDEFPFSPLI
jgi:hypothetical protein